MFLRCDISLEPTATQELENYIKDVLPGQLNEALFKDKNYLDKIIRECVKGQFKAILNEILQDKQVKEVLRDRVFKTLDIDFSPNCENVCDAK